jgi:hypothetical protein
MIEMYALLCFPEAHSLMTVITKQFLLMGITLAF